MVVGKMEKDSPSSALSALNKTKHTCIVCATQFEGSKAAKYCSNACKQAAKYQRAKDGIVARPMARMRKIRMSPEDIVAISSLLQFIRKLKDRNFPLDLIVENEKFLFEQYETTLQSIKDEITNEQ